MKLFLYVLIIASSGMYGILRAYSVSEKNSELLSFINAFEKLKIELEYRRSPFYDISARIDHRFFENLSRLCKTMDDVTFGEIWRLAAENTYPPGALTDEAAKEISGIGEELGTTGIPGQCRIIDLHLAVLSRMYEAEENEKHSRCRLYTSLGFAAGITIVILFV